MKKTFAKLLATLMALTLMLGCFAGCGEKNTKVAIGVQSGTTGESFLKGDADWGFDGFANIDTKAYDNAGLAVEDMKNGNIKYVVIDAAVGKELASKNKEIKVIGSWTYQAKDWMQACDMLKEAQKDGLPVEELLTHKYALADINEAMEMNISMQGLKIVVKGE